MYERYDENIANRWKCKAQTFDYLFQLEEGYNTVTKAIEINPKNDRFWKILRDQLMESGRNRVLGVGNVGEWDFLGNLFLPES